MHYSLQHLPSFLAAGLVHLTRLNLLLLSHSIFDQAQWHSTSYISLTASRSCLSVICRVTLEPEPAHCVHKTSHTYELQNARPRMATRFQHYLASVQDLQLSVLWPPVVQFSCESLNCPMVCTKFTNRWYCCLQLTFLSERIFTSEIPVRNRYVSKDLRSLELSQLL